MAQPRRAGDPGLERLARTVKAELQRRGQAVVWRRLADAAGSTDSTWKKLIGSPPQWIERADAREKIERYLGWTVGDFEVVRAGGAPTKAAAPPRPEPDAPPWAAEVVATLALVRTEMSEVRGRLDDLAERLPPGPPESGRHR